MVSARYLFLFLLTPLPMLTNWQSDAIQASSIKDVETAVKLFDLDYNAGLEKYALKIPLGQQKVVVTD
jgi:hypothetical protein